MNITIKPNKLNGKLNVISSKSFSIRAIICACISEGKSYIKNINLCEDVKNTINILRESFDIKIKNNTLEIDGGIKKLKKKHYQIYESATLLRLILPLISYYSEEEICVELEKRLFDRGIEEYEKLFIESSKQIRKENNKIYLKSFPIETYYSISAENSSQYVSGLILLASTLKQDTTINIKNNAKSLPYIDLTIDVLKQFNANIKRVGNNVFVMHNQIMRGTTITIPSDASFALNLSVMNLLGSNIDFSISEFDNNDPDYSSLKKIQETKTLSDIEDLSNNPDSLFPLAILATTKTTPTTFLNVKRLNNKESKRLDNLILLINSFGGKTSLNNDELVIYPSKLECNQINTFNDHRIAFLSLIMSTISNKSVTINSFECVEKSYPNLLTDFEKLGLDYVIEQSAEELEYSFDGKNTKIILGQGATKTLSKYNKTKNKKILFIDKNISQDITNKIKEYLGENTIEYRFVESKEKIKNTNTFEEIIRFLLENEVSKKDTIFTLGGGSLLDLLSFVSSVYKRGIDVVSIPTTLLSFVDASIGGKCGIDFGDYKNMIGSFNNPKTIIIDYDFLNTLPKEELKSGMAEIIKIAAVSDSKLFYDILDNPPYSKLEKWIKQAIVDKIKFIEIDPYDEKERHALNFGHTIAHSIELKQKLSHGEAVAMGMANESKNETIKQALIKYNFKLELYNKNNDIIKNDKKRELNEIILVDVEEIGSYIFKKITL